MYSSIHRNLARTLCSDDTLLEDLYCVCILASLVTSCRMNDHNKVLYQMFSRSHVIILDKKPHTTLYLQSNYLANSFL